MSKSENTNKCKCQCHGYMNELGYCEHCSEWMKSGDNNVNGSGGVESERMPEREVEQQPPTESIDKWLNTDQHKYNCAAYSEGQYCCLDKEHINQQKLEELINSRIVAELERLSRLAADYPSVESVIYGVTNRQIQHRIKELSK